MLRKILILVLLTLLTVPLMAQTEASVQAAIREAQAQLGTRPSNWQYTILTSSNSSLGCPLVTGTALGREVTVYRVELTYATGVYVVYASQDGAMVVLCDSKFTGATAPVTGSATATAIPSGQSTEAIANAFATKQLYPCPVGFTPYLAPRIVMGRATARVEAGGAPNRIRVQPTTNAAVGTQVGQIPPTTIIDEVLVGPACSDTYVWWFVSQGGIQGWTVESDYSSADYFLEPAPGAPVATNSTVQILTPTRLGAWDITARPSLMLYLPDGRLAIRSTNDMNATDTLHIFDSVGQLTASLPQVHGIYQMLLTPNKSELVIVNAVGDVSFFDVVTLTPTRQFTAVFGLHAAEGALVSGVGGVIALHPDGQRMIAGGCAQFEGGGVGRLCEKPLLNIINLVQNTVLNTITLPDSARSYVDLLISPDGNKLVVLARPDTLVIDLTTLQISATLRIQVETELGSQYVTKAAFNTLTGNLLTTVCSQAATVVGCTEAQLMIWDVNTGQNLATVPLQMKDPYALAFSEIVNMIAIGSGDGIVTLLDGGTNSVIMQTQALRPEGAGAGIAIEYVSSLAMGGGSMAVSGQSSVYTFFLVGMQP